MNEQGNLKIAEKGARLSIVAYLILAVFKLTVGYFANSIALTADGLNNSTDILASVAVLIGLKISQKPADENHPYGHLKAETIASLVASLIMVSVGINVLYNGVETIFTEEKEVPNILASLVSIISGIVMLLVYLYNRNMAVRINSSGLLAAAKDNLSDAFVSFGTAIGIIGTYFGLKLLDPIIGGVIGLIIIKTGYEIFRESSHTLTDGINKDDIKRIKAIIISVNGVRCVKDLKARRHGNRLLIDVIIGVDPTITVQAGHDITILVEQEIRKHYDIVDVLIHVEPDCTTKKRNEKKQD